MHACMHQICNMRYSKGALCVLLHRGNGVPLSLEKLSFDNWHQEMASCIFISTLSATSTSRLFSLHISVSSGTAAAECP